MAYVVRSRFNYSWKLIIKEAKDGSTSCLHKLVRIEEPIMRIPMLAIHLNRSVNSDGFKFNTQTQLVLMLATAVKAELQKTVDENNAAEVKKNADKQKHHPVLLQLIADKAGCKPNEICDFELQICDTQPSLIGGLQKEFVLSGRLDNLCMSLKALIDSTDSVDSLDNESNVRMVALFDHEEIGSNSAQRAGSPVIIDALSRITKAFNHSDPKLLEKAIQRSFPVSADMAHALHPNHMDKHEENHQPKLHSGLVIKHNANQRYATNAVTSFIFREIAERNNLPVQFIPARKT